MLTKRERKIMTDLRLLTSFVLICLVPSLIEARSQTGAVWPDEYDDLRMSSSSLNGENYHSITPNRDISSQRRLTEQLQNQIGKPLVAPRATNWPLPSASSQLAKQQTMPASSYYSKMAPSQLVARHQPSWAAGRNGDDGLDLSVANWFDEAPARGSCRWSPLREFSSVSLNAGELIIRDALDQPCYIVTIQAYVKHDDNSYFPLRNLRPHPLGAYKVEFAGVTANNRHANERLVLNCSPLSIGVSEQVSNQKLDSGTNRTGPLTSATLISQERANRAFNESITIQVDCGYLVLKLHGEGNYLSLDEIAFYQNGNIAAVQTDTSNIRGRQVGVAGTNRKAGPGLAAAVVAPRPKPVSDERAKSSLAAPSMQSQHLVFSSKNDNAIMSQDGSIKPALPLILMPAYSRYVCQRRIELTGSNLVQLVLDRFELKRLTSEPAETPAAERGSIMPRLERDHYVESRPRRNVHTTTIIYKRPMNAVTSCTGQSSQAQQQRPLTSMMDLSGLRQTNDTTANRWIFADALHKSSAGSSTKSSWPNILHFIIAWLVLRLSLSCNLANRAARLVSAIEVDGSACDDLEANRTRQVSQLMSSECR